MSEQKDPKPKPGVCIPWEQRKKELPKISGDEPRLSDGRDEQLIRKVWEDIDALGYMYIWQCLLSF